MRSANMPEGVGAPKAKSPRDSVLRDLEVQISRKRGPRAETRTPHGLHAEDEKPKTGVLCSWQGEWGVNNQPCESGWPLAARAD